MKNIFNKAIILFSLISLISCGNPSIEGHKYFAFKNSSGDWGYFDKEGKIVINPQFESAGAFKDGIARVSLTVNNEQKFTYIDTKGNYDLNNFWDGATEFNGGLAIVINDFDYPKAINSNFETVIEFKNALYVSHFSDGRAFKITLESNGPRLEIINTKGETIKILDKINDEALAEWGSYYGIDRQLISSFTNGVGSYEVGFRPNEISGRFEQYRSLIDDKGEEIANLGWEITYLSEFKNDLALFKTSKWGIMDKQGKIIVNPQFDEIFFDGEYGFIVKSGEKWGWIDNMGSFLINPQFNDVRNLGFNNNGLAPVKVGKKWGYIDRSGKLVINPQFEFASSFHGDVALIYEKGAGHGLINNEGLIITIPQFEDVLPEYYSLPQYKESSRIDDFFVETKYINTDAIANEINLNIKEGSIFTLNHEIFNIRTFINSAGDYNSKTMVFSESCESENNESGYYIKNLSHYRNYAYWYDSKGLYRQEQGYWPLSSLEDLNPSTEAQSRSFTQGFSLSLVRALGVELETCTPNIQLEKITFNANVWSSKTISKGFNTVVQLQFDPELDKFSESYSNVRLYFKEMKVFPGWYATVWSEANQISRLNNAKRMKLKYLLEEKISLESDSNRSILVEDIDKDGFIVIKI